MNETARYGGEEACERIGSLELLSRSRRGLKLPTGLLYTQAPHEEIAT